jgi:hypothetical protein
MGMVTRVPYYAGNFLLRHAFSTPAFPFIRTLAAW